MWTCWLTPFASIACNTVREKSAAPSSVSIPNQWDGFFQSLGVIREPKDIELTLAFVPVSSNPFEHHGRIFDCDTINAHPCFVPRDHISIEKDLEKILRHPNFCWTRFVTAASLETQVLTIYAGAFIVHP
jgi:hypothetical protein